MRYLLIIIFVVAVIAAVTGYVSNIITLAGMDWAVGVTIESLLRIIGIVVAPLGAVMGYV